MKVSTLPIAAVAALVFAAPAFALSSGGISSKPQLRSDAPIVEPAAYGKKCRTVKKVRWHHGKKIVKVNRVCW